MSKHEVEGTHVRSLRGFARSSLRSVSVSIGKYMIYDILYLCVGHDRYVEQFVGELTMSFELFRGPISKPTINFEASQILTSRPA